MARLNDNIVAFMRFHSWNAFDGVRENGRRVREIQKKIAGDGECIVYCYPTGNDFKLIALDFGFAVYYNDFITVSIIQKMFYSLMAIALGL